MQALVCVPLPQVLEQAPQALHPPLIGQHCVLQACELAPEQAVPHELGAGLVQVLVCVPPPQVTEHVLQAVQPPLMGVHVGGQSPGQVAFVSVPLHIPSPQHGDAEQLCEVAVQ